MCLSIAYLSAHEMRTTLFQHTYHLSGGHGGENLSLLFVNAFMCVYVHMCVHMLLFENAFMCVSVCVSLISRFVTDNVCVCVCVSDK